MKSKTIYRVASVVMVLITILGNTIQTQAALPVANVTSPSIYWGALVNGKVPSSTNLQGVFNTFETRSGKKMSIIHWGESWILSDGTWGEFQTSYFDNVRNHGAIPMINWDSQRSGAGINQAAFQLRDVYSGTYDTYIQRWATAAKNWGHPFFLYFDPEMNGWWEPWGEGKLSNGTIVNGNSAGDYVKAWRHVHDIFSAVGATNVTWVWAPNHMSKSSQYPVLSTLYPGDAYVDWTGLSVYNKYNTWAGLNPLLTGSEGMTWFRNSYNDVLTLAPNKPMMLAQWASIEAGDGGAKKAAWITDALTVQIPTNFPKIKAIVWFNWQEVPSETYPIETSQAATSAWAAGIGSPIYAANQFSNLNTSPVPPLATVVNVEIGSNSMGNYTMQQSGSQRLKYAGIDSGPVQVTSNGAPVIASLRDLWSDDSKWSSSTQLMGLPAGQLSSTYVFPAYNNVSLDDQLRFGNVGNMATTVTVTIGGVYKGSYSLNPSESTRVSYSGLDSGPVVVQSSGGVPIIASIRDSWSDGSKWSSYSQLMGLPGKLLSSTYVFPAYNNVSLDDQLRFGNVGSAPTNVSVTIGGTYRGTYSLSPGQSMRVSYAGIDSGPVIVQSSGGVPIIASIRDSWWDGSKWSSYFQLMGLPGSLLSDTYVFPIYDNVNADAQLRVGNVGSAPTTVTVTIAGDVKGTYSLNPSQSLRVQYPVNAGPLIVQSSGNVPIIASIRDSLWDGSTWSSYSQLMGLPASQLSSTYMFPAYNNVSYDNELRIAVP